jgi:hypothetical protein
MAKHEAPEPRRHRIGRRLAHPISHVITLVTPHIVALCVIEKTPLLALLFLH